MTQYNAADTGIDRISVPNGLNLDLNTIWIPQCGGSGMFIPDPTFFHPGSRTRTVSIPDPGSSSKNLSILTPQKTKKWFLSSKKYDPGCSSRIPDPDADFLPIPDSGVKKAPNPGSRIRNTGIRTVILTRIKEAKILNKKYRNGMEPDIFYEELKAYHVIRKSSLEVKELLLSIYSFSSSNI